MSIVEDRSKTNRYVRRVDNSFLEIIKQTRELIEDSHRILAESRIQVPPTDRFSASPEDVHDRLKLEATEDDAQNIAAVLHSNERTTRAMKDAREIVRSRPRPL